MSHCLTICFKTLNFPQSLFVHKTAYCNNWSLWHVTYVVIRLSKPEQMLSSFFFSLSLWEQQEWLLSFFHCCCRSNLAVLLSVLTCSLLTADMTHKTLQNKQRHDSLLRIQQPRQVSIELTTLTTFNSGVFSNLDPPTCTTGAPTTQQSWHHAVLEPNSSQPDSPIVFHLRSSTPQSISLPPWTW